MPTNSYDVVAIGDDLATHVTAALCARRGLRTLLLTHDDRPARYTIGPYKLPVEPLTWTARSPHAADRIVRELQIDLALRRRIREARVPAQLVGPDARADLTSDPSHPGVLAEFSREFGEATMTAADAVWQTAASAADRLDEITSGMHAFPAVSFWERRAVARLLTMAMPAAAPFENAINAVDGHNRDAAAMLRTLVHSGARIESATGLGAARALDAWLGGPLPLRGDGDALRELLLEKLALAGGEVKSAKAVSFARTWRKITSVRLMNGEDIGAGQIIAGIPPTDLVAMFGNNAPKKLVQIAAEADLAGYQYTLNLVIERAGIPEGMAPIVVVVRDATLPLGGSNSFSIHMGEPDEQNRVVVTVATILGAGAPLDPDTIARETAILRRALLRELDVVMPFFAEHTLLIHTPHQDEAPEVPGGRGSHDAPRGMPLPMRTTYRPKLPGSADLAAMPYAAGLANLTLTGGQILPGMGIEGELVAGWSAAKRACIVAGRKKDYLRRETVGVPAKT